MNSPQPNDFLPQALADWRLRPPRDPDFRTAVWARITDVRRGASWTAYARTHLPALAGALALALLLGGWAGRTQARAGVEADRAQIVQAYVEGLDARAMWAH